MGFKPFSSQGKPFAAKNKRAKVKKPKAAPPAGVGDEGLPLIYPKAAQKPFAKKGRP